MSLVLELKLEKITSRLNLRIKLKSTYSSPKKSIVRTFSFQVGAEIIFYAKIFINLYYKISTMKIHCPNFVPKSGGFYQICVKVCPKQLPFPSFQGNFTTLLFCGNFCFFKQEQ